MPENLAITDPRFNLREITKQMILLEEHLTQPHKVCMDCIRKHLMCIEGLSEEGMCLDKDQKFEIAFQKTYTTAIRAIHAIEDETPLPVVGQSIRKVRKALTKSTFSLRVASIPRNFPRQRCPHEG